jgi:hypothetical protein
MSDHSKKDIKRLENLHRLKRIIGGSFKKFGNHPECKCEFEIRFDTRINESVGDVKVCSYCEWSCCSEGLLKSNLDVVCEKCK